MKIYLCHLNTAKAECKYSMFLWDFTACRLKTTEVGIEPTEVCPYVTEADIQEKIDEIP